MLHIYDALHQGSPGHSEIKAICLHLAENLDPVTRFIIHSQELGIPLSSSHSTQSRMVETDY